jgi:hypothetical protein
MAKPIYKIILFLKRNPELTREEFEEMYEGVHAPFCEKMMGPGSCRYLRRYLRFIGAPHADVTSLDYDAVTELWYDDRAQFELVAERLAKHKMPDEVLPYEARLLDRPNIRVATAIEFDSDFGKSGTDVFERLAQGLEDLAQA